MKKTLTIITLVLALVLTVVGCDWNTQTPTNPDDKTNVTEPTNGTDTGQIQNYFPTSKMNSEKHLKVIEGFGVDRLGRHSFITATAFQGLMNREEVRYYVNYEIIKEGVSSSQYWLDE